MVKKRKRCNFSLRTLHSTGNADSHYIWEWNNTLEGVELAYQGEPRQTEKDMVDIQKLTLCSCASERCLTLSAALHTVLAGKQKKIKDSGFSYLVWKRRTVKMEQTRKIRIWKKVDILNYISAISNFGNKQRAKERKKKNHRAHKPPATVVILRETCWRLCLAYDRWTRSVLSEWPSTLSPTIACTVTRQLSNLPDRPRIALSVHEHVRVCVWVCAHVIAIVLQSNTPVEVQRLANY